MVECKHYSSEMDSSTFAKLAPELRHHIYGFAPMQLRACQGRSGSTKKRPIS